jgi:hypothetical protein
VRNDFEAAKDAYDGAAAVDASLHARAPGWRCRESELARDRAKLGKYLIHHPSRPSRSLSGAGTPADPVLLIDDGLDQRLMNVWRIGHRKIFHPVASEQADGHRFAGGKLDPALRAHDLVHLLVGVCGVTPDTTSREWSAL